MVCLDMILTCEGVEQISHGVHGVGVDLLFSTLLTFALTLHTATLHTWNQIDGKLTPNCQKQEKKLTCGQLFSYFFFLGAPAPNPVVFPVMFPSLCVLQASSKKQISRAANTGFPKIHLILTLT